jgi:hypothetical protein
MGRPPPWTEVRLPALRHIRPTTLSREAWRKRTSTELTVEIVFTRPSTPGFTSSGSRPLTTRRKRSFAPLPVYGGMAHKGFDAVSGEVSRSTGKFAPRATRSAECRTALLSAVS